MTDDAEQPAIFAELPTYAPQKDESAAQYITRLESIQNPDTLAVRAGRIIATAIDQGVYHLADTEEDRDELGHALHHIVEALKKYDGTQGLAGVNDRIMSAGSDGALKQIKARAGQRGLDVGVLKDLGNKMKSARGLIADKAQEDIKRSLSIALNITWQEIKMSKGFEPEENVPSGKIIKAFKENSNGRLSDTSESDLIEQIHNLRQYCRGGPNK